MNKQIVSNIHQGIRDLKYIDEEIKLILTELIVVDDMIDILERDSREFLYRVLTGNESWKPYAQWSKEEVVQEVKLRNFMVDEEELNCFLFFYYDFNLPGLLNKPSLEEIQNALNNNAYLEERHESDLMNSNYEIQ
jgi:hypothetical protein